MSRDLAKRLGAKYLGSMTVPTLSAHGLLSWDRMGMDDEELWQIAQEYSQTEAAADELRARLYAGIYEYKEANGWRRGWQTDLVAKTKLTRERIRQIIAIEAKRRSSELNPASDTTK